MADEATQDKPPRVILCVPGPWESPSEVARAVAESRQGFLFAGVIMVEVAKGRHATLEVQGADPRLREAFSIAGSGRLTAGELDAVGSHRSVLYLLGPGGSPEAAADLMRFAQGLLNAGGVAVKVETAGVAHGKQSWGEMTAAPHALNLYRAYVTLVGHGDCTYSCGMHNLGQRDAILTGEPDVSHAAAVIRDFLLYVLVEQPTIREGATFSPSADGPVYRLNCVPCTTYFADDELFDVFHNPYGMWQLTRLTGR